MKHARVAALFDGTAIYFCSRRYRSEQKRLDCEALDRELKAKAAADAFDPGIFYTAVDPRNTGQARFCDFIHQRLHWNVEPRSVWSADPSPHEAERHNELIRFDSSIAFALGRLVDRCDRIIVVTDSFGVEPPLRTAAEYGLAKIVLAFFGRHLDPRWFDALRNGKIELWDLDDNPPLFRYAPRAGLSSPFVPTGQRQLSRLSDASSNTALQPANWR